MRPLVPVVRHEGRDGLCPVPHRAVYEDRVAPPVVGYLVAERCRRYEREPYHGRAKKRKGRHAVAGWKEVLDDSELLERVGAYHRLEGVEVFFCLVDICPCERVLFLREPVRGRGEEYALFAYDAAVNVGHAPFDELFSLPGRLELTLEAKGKALSGRGELYRQQVQILCVGFSIDLERIAVRLCPGHL